MHLTYSIHVHENGKPIGYISGEQLAFYGEAHKPLIFDSRVGAEIASAKWEAIFAERCPSRNYTVHIIELEL